MSRTLRVASRVPFILVLLILAGYLWLFGSDTFPEWEDYSKAVSYYVVLLVAFLVFSRIRNAPYLNTPANIAGRQFLIGFVATLVAMLALLGVSFIATNSIAPSLIIPMILMQVFIVAPSEELMFRGVLLSYVGIIFSAILFAVWHSVTYGILWNVPSTWFGLFGAFGFGVILGFVARDPRLGLPACIGAHACWNLVIIGVI